MERRTERRENPDARDLALAATGRSTIGSKHCYVTSVAIPTTSVPRRAGSAICWPNRSRHAPDPFRAVFGGLLASFSNPQHVSAG